MADVRLGKRDWKQLRKLKLFVVPAIAMANYDDKLKKADLVRHAQGSTKPVTIRISSDLCDSIPVTHEKAEAALLSYNVYAKANPHHNLKPLSAEKDIIASVFRPVLVLKTDTPDLFNAGTEHIATIEKISGLHAMTLANVRAKGRLNAHCCDRLARAALAVKLFHSIAAAGNASFAEAEALARVMAWQEPVKFEQGMPNLLVDSTARHTLLDRYIAFAATLDETGLGDRKLAGQAGMRLRDFFSSDFEIFKGQIAQNEKAYLLHDDDQLPAPEDWVEWSSQ